MTLNILDVASKPAMQGLTKDALKEVAKSLGQPSFRATQLFSSIYRRRITAFEEMTDLPKALRERLAAEYRSSAVTVAKVFTSTDGTRRYLFDVDGNQQIESVWIPEEHRDTICISSQAGCPLACDFCMTGVIGLKRNLTAGEIVGQVIAVLNQVYGPGIEPPHGVNIVMMGMGEPLLNYDNVMTAIRLMADKDGLNIAQRRITLSTAGVVPQIYELAKEEVRPELAISLAAPNDELRDKLIPINKKYPISKLIQACSDYPLRDRERITFEYVMLDGVNDSAEHARQLAGLVSGLQTKINLIPHNSVPELPYRPSPMSRIIEFQKVLAGRNIRSFIRRPRGRDINAACGQLAARKEATA
ncbi:MAG TPA: 23S rRNA (adenine(2503)-C(2))-methyltransferase RlmN [Blastocatellia bacterium]|nr:23S rRNA (adenine(2503)-C(2))-methyltransferase RlmN [Blastocatellia bacterium]